MPHLSDYFTAYRWKTNPFQITGLMSVIVTSIIVLIYGQLSSDSLWSEINNSDTQRALAVCSLFGSALSFYGLHLRALPSALWLELSGYVSLFFVFLVFIIQVGMVTVAPVASYGYMLVMSFLVASALRSIQIILYERARRRKERLTVMVMTATDIARKNCE